MHTPASALFPRRQILVRTLFAALASVSAARAADFYKADNEVSLNAAITVTPAPWVNLDGTAVDAIPTNSANNDTWRWDDRILAATYPDGVQNLSLSGDRWTGKLIFTNMAVPVVITGTTGISLTLGGSSSSSTGGAGGDIDMSAATQDVTISTFNTGTNLGIRLHAGASSYTFRVAAGRTLTFNAAKIAVRSGGSNSVVTFPGPGKVIFNDQFQVSHAQINGGRVEFNSPTGTTRIATSTTAVPLPPISYTNIDGGVVMVNNTSGSATGDSIVNINNTGTLGGAGRITGSTNSVVNANSGSTIAPGNDGVGTLSIGKLNLAAGSRINWEASSTAADLLAVTGSNGLTIGGATTIYLYNPGTTNPLSTTGEFTLISYSGNLTGSINDLSIAEESKIPGLNYTLTQVAGAIKLDISEGAVTPIDWSGDASGNWSTGTNWTGGVAPDAAKALVRITGDTGATFTAPRTVTLDGSRTVGKLYLDAIQSVTLDGPGTLSFDQGTGSSVLVASRANHIVAVPVALPATGLSTTVEEAGTTLTLGGVISGVDSPLGKLGAGTLLLTADNTYTGTTTVASGTLQVGNGGTTGAVAGPIVTSGTVRFDRSDSISLGHAISGSGSVAFAGTGTTTLSAANTYSGATTLSAGTLNVAHAQALQNTTLTYSAGGGALVVLDPVANLTLGGLAGNGALPLTNSTGAALAITVGGNGASNTYSGSPAGTGASFTKTGAGTLDLSGTHAYSGATSVTGGILSLNTGANFTTATAGVATGATARLLVNGGTFTASGLTTLNNATGGIAVAGGTANFNGGITNPYAETTNAFINVTGGVLNAASVSLGRGNLNQGSEPASGQTANGLYINGGTVNVTGDLRIGAISGANSSVSSRIDSGTLNVGGVLALGINNTARWSTFDVNGGAVTSTDSATGILLGGAPTAGSVVMHIRNASAVVTAERIQFGQTDLAGTSNLKLVNGALYVGSGGLVVGSSNAGFVATLALDGGTLGATANWSSNVPMTLNGDISVTAADASNVPHTITLSGPATGLGVLTKNGSGTAFFTSTASDITGGATVNAGTLGLGGKVGQLTVNAGSTFAPQGVLKSDYATTLDGTLAIGYNSINTPAVPGIQSDFAGITLGAGSSLVVTGTGNLASGTYVILKASTGITGTFGTVSLPAGLTLNYNYDDDANPETPAAVALVGSVTALSPYDTWTTSFSLTGNAALPASDPDADGLVNQLEYALQTSPVAASSAAYTVSRPGNFLTLGFNQPGDASLTYAIEATNDLGTAWTVVHTFTPFTAAGAALYTDTADLTTNPRRFLRLKVTPTPAP